MANKWTIGSNNEGLYNGVKPPEEGTTKKKKKKEQEGRVTVASGKTQLKRTFYLRAYPLDIA